MALTPLRLIRPEKTTDGNRHVGQRRLEEVARSLQPNRCWMPFLWRMEKCAQSPARMSMMRKSFIKTVTQDSMRLLHTTEHSGHIKKTRTTDTGVTDGTKKAVIRLLVTPRR